MPVEPRRKRRAWTRSTRGCRTCRLRHVKCDETYPSCKRCSSAGRTCDGCSEPPDAWEVHTVASISPSPERRASPGQYDKDAEVSFAFFQLRTVDYFADLLGVAWKPLVLRAAEKNNAIYHAALAVGSMHKTVIRRQLLSTDLNDDEYAVKQYTYSLRKLASSEEGEPTNSADVVLAACVLYIGFESLRRNHAVVLEHVKNGVRILQQYGNDHSMDDQDAIIPFHHFVPAFARLERQSQELTGASSSLIKTLVAEQEATGYFNYENLYPQPVPMFLTIYDAWRSLHQRWHALLAWVECIQKNWFSHEIPDPNLERRKFALVQDFQVWSLGLKELGTRGDIFTPREAAIYALLECHILLAEMVLDTASSPREMRWDKYLDHLKRVVQLCRVVIQYEETDTKTSEGSSPSQIVVLQRYAPDPDIEMSGLDGKRRCPLTFDMSVCMVLLHVVQKCRDAQVRLDAIRLLEAHPRLEGLWDGLIIAQIGRAIDFVERNGASLEDAAARGALASEIPSRQRVVSMEGGLKNNEREAKLILVQARGENGTDPVPLECQLAW